MVDVARILWKFIVGVKDLLVLLFLLLFFALLFALLRSSPNPGAVKQGVMMLDLNGSIAEQPAAVDPLGVLLSVTAPVQEYRQRNLVRALDLAAKDKRVKAVALDLDGFTGGGQVSVAEVGEALGRVKKAGKPVYAFATAYFDKSYLLAAHASEVWLNPMGGVALTGPGGSNLYYKELLDRTGIEAHIYRVGTYKSAVEPYLRSDQSPEAKAALSAVYAEYWEQAKSDISKARPKADIDAVLSDPAGQVEAAKGDLARLALGQGLVDKLGSRLAFGQMLAAKYGAGDTETPGDFAQFPAEAMLASQVEDRSGDAIAVVTAAGTIVDGEAGPGMAGGKTISNQILQAVADKGVKGLVLRVDSPGGSALASEEIRLALLEAKKRKLPVIVSMANLAASGGYWIAAPADVIFAEPATITGSIGIFGVIPSGEKALAKLGINADGVQTTPLSGEPDLIGGISPEFDRIAQSAVENGYRDFLTRVAEGRGKTTAQIDAIGQGRIWAGGTARQLGLVDRLGGMEEALAEAAKRAGLDDDGWHARYIEPQPSFAQRLLGGAVQAFAAKDQTGAQGRDIFALAGMQQGQIEAAIRRDLSLLFSAKSLQAHCLECGDFGSQAAIADSMQSGWLSWLLAND